MDEFNEFELSSGCTVAVGTFHTHPPLTKWLVPGGKTAQRNVGPSDNDHPPRYDIPGFVYDYIGEEGIHYSTDGIDYPAHIIHFGGNQRNNPF